MGTSAAPLAPTTPIAVTRTQAHYEAIPDVVYTDPQAAAGGPLSGAFSDRPDVRGRQDRHLHPRLRPDNGFLTLFDDGKRLTGASALGPEAGEWLQQATLAIRARVPLGCCATPSSPSPLFSEIYVRHLSRHSAARSAPAGQPA